MHLTPFSQAVIQPKPACATRFGMVEIRIPEQDKAKALYEAGIALGKAGDGTLAAQKLEEAITAYKGINIKYDVANAYTAGVAPGLQPNPGRAGELLEQIVKSGEFHFFSTPNHFTLGESYVKLAKHDSKYMAKAVEQFEKSAGNMNFYGTMGIVTKLVTIGELGTAKKLLTDYMKRRPLTYGHEFAERLNIAKIFAGVPRPPEQPGATPALPQADLSGLQDAQLATQTLKEIGEHGVTPKAVRLEVVNIFAAGQGAVKQDKDFAKSLIDKL